MRVWAPVKILIELFSSNQSFDHFRRLRGGLLESNANTRAMATDVSMLKILTILNFDGEYALTCVGNYASKFCIKF